jgi:hypothetical protein
MARKGTHGTGAVGDDQQLTMLVKPFSLCNLVRVDPEPSAAARIQAKRNALHRGVEMIFPQEREVVGIEDPHRAVGSQ